MAKAPLSETELRNFHLNHLYRQIYHARVYVCSASVILDARARGWYKEAGLDRLRNQPDAEKTLELFKVFFEEQAGTVPISWEMSEALGLVESSNADTKNLIEAWIEEITRRRTKEWVRKNFNL